MKRIIRRKLRNRKRRHEARLAEAVAVNEGGPTLGGGLLKYELSEKARAIEAGGIGAMHKLVQGLGLPAAIDDRVELLKVHAPYHESDHVLNIAYNVLCGGRTLDDIERRRNSATHLRALGAKSIPDPTTAGDFCRRFDEATLWELMAAINETRTRVWRQHPTLTQERPRIDGDGTLVETTGTTKGGMDISYDGRWGYQVLVVSLWNTAEPLFLVNRSGNRPSHEGAPAVFNRAIELVRAAGFEKAPLLRGDTDFSLTAHFDGWDDDGVKFVFGVDASSHMRDRAEGLSESLYQELVRKMREVAPEKQRARPANVKAEIIKERGFKNLRLKREDIAVFFHQPRKCRRKYRVVALRKQVEQSQGTFDVVDETRYHFYITNDPSLSAREVVLEANQRCDQENLIAQLKGGLRALHAPVNNLLANWAYMVMAALAWSIKAWAALSIPISPRWRLKHIHEQQRLLRMEFRGFVDAVIRLPAQIITTGRRTVFRLLGDHPSHYELFRILDGIDVRT